MESEVDLYAVAGGAAFCRTLSAGFYGRVQHDPVLRPLFPGKTLRCAIEELAAFLVQLLGGPPDDWQFRHWVSLRESHLRHRIGKAERDAWLRLMSQTLAEQTANQPELHAALRWFFELASAYVVNTGDRVVPPGADAGAGLLHRQLARNWHLQQRLDQAVAAIRAGDARGAIEMAGDEPLRSHFARRPGIYATMLATMLASPGREAFEDYICASLRREPSLAAERFDHSRTLLHCAAAAASSCEQVVEVLLALGASPHAKSGGGHTPLYDLANQCTSPAAGARVARRLATAGAEVDACDGVKRCTPLHMAARRGSVEIAEALLECGAMLEAADSAGDTPLRRAVNCNQTAMAAFLITRGANIHSRGNKGLTPLQAARTAPMRELFVQNAGRPRPTF